MLGTELKLYTILNVYEMRIMTHSEQNVSAVRKILILIWVHINPLPDDKILDWSKLKQLPDDILKCI